MLRTSASNNSKTKADGRKVGADQSSNSPDSLNDALTDDTVAESVGDPQASESRHDPITGNWTIFAPDRDCRPNEFKSPQQKEASVKVDCPFCLGKESNTPDPIWVGRIVDAPATGPDNSPARIYCGDQIAGLASDDWSVRVVPNKYPAVTVNGLTEATPTRKSPLFQRNVISGGHEVIIESPRHVASLTELDLSEVALVFTAIRDRIRFWSNVEDIKYVGAFKNVGGDAGASLSHSHSQLVATDIMPPLVKNIIQQVTAYRAKSGCCLQCDLIRGELKEEARVIAKSDSLVAFCPFASPLPMMARITSVEHIEDFGQLDEITLESVSRMVFRIVSWLEKLYPGTAYNLMFNSRPPGMKQRSDAYHWSIDIFPRLTHIAGFEFSSNCMINPVLPEDAAARYRHCGAAEDPRFVL